MQLVNFTPKRTLRHLSAVVGIAIIMGVGLSACAREDIPTTDAWSRKQMDLVSSFVSQNNQDDDDDFPYLVAHDVTDSFCTSARPCTQAVASDYVTIAKFDSMKDADSAAQAFGDDADQLDVILVIYNGTPVSPKVRNEITQTVAGINSSSSD